MQLLGANFTTKEFCGPKTGHYEDMMVISVSENCI
jgi:hypothetical protein